VISEALDTLWTLGKAMAIWLIAFAIVATALLYTIAAAAIATFRGLRRTWQRTPTPAWARNRIAARRLARTRTYEEAA
jgi:hypothetical protein